MDELRKFGLVYVGSPYTRYIYGIEAAFAWAVRTSYRLHKLHIPHWSPIVEGHPLTMQGLVEVRDVDFWQRFCRPKINKSDAFLIAAMQGWDTSDGIAREINIFVNQGKPIYFLNPETFDVTDYLAVAA